MRSSLQQYSPTSALQSGKLRASISRSHFSAAGELLDDFSRERFQNILSRQDAKSAKKNIFSELGELCVFARVIVYSRSFKARQRKTSNGFG
jgi:hypothetical protein